MIDLATGVLVSLGYLLWKGAKKGQTTVTPPPVTTPGPSKPSEVRWPTAKETTEQKKERRGTTTVHHGPEFSEVPQMQKGMPGVTDFAHAAVEQMIKEKAEQEKASGRWRPAKRASATEARRAKELLKEWRSGAIWPGETANRQYRAAMHGNHRGVEVWERV